MICSVNGCGHPAAIEMHPSHWTPDRWRGYCGCCAEFALLLFALRGSTVEYRKPGAITGNAVTHNDVEAAHDALTRDDVKVADLF